MKPKYLPINETYSNIEEIIFNARGLSLKIYEEGREVTTVYPKAFERCFEIKIKGAMAGVDAGKISIKID